VCCAPVPSSPSRFQCQEQSTRQADLLLQVATLLQTRRSYVYGDVLQAPTGTGKTIAFLLPALQRLLLLEERVHVGSCGMRGERGKIHALGPATAEDARRAGKAAPEACGLLIASVLLHPESECSRGCPDAGGGTDKGARAAVSPGPGASTPKCGGSGFFESMANGSDS